MKLCIAYCKCGYKSKEMIDAGRRAYESGPLLFPSLCEKCNDVVEVDFDRRIPQCPNCRSENIIPYDDKLIGVKGEHTYYFNVSQTFGRGFQLTNGIFKCPKCKKMTLEFFPQILDVD